MRAVSISKYGEAFKVKTISKPSITKHNEILIKMKYAPINASDIFYMKGVYGLRKPLPTTGGFEGCGIIEDAANHDLIGKKVSCWAEDSYNYGTWADYFLAPEKNVIVYDNEHEHIDDKDFSKYCSPFTNPFTAISFVEIAQSHKAQTVVFQNAASPVTRIAIKLFAKFGVKTIAIVHEKELVEEIRSLGATHVFHQEEEQHLEENLIDTIYKEKAKVFYDSVGGHLSGKIFNSLQTGGQLVTYGKIHHSLISDIDSAGLIFKHKTLRGFWLPEYLKEKTEHDIQNMKELVHSNISTVFQTRIQEELPLEKIDLAFHKAVASNIAGKIVLSI